MHDRGLKLGIYGDMGTLTCGGYPGTPLDKVEIDAKTFAEWEVDMLKFDGCYSNDVEQQQGTSTTSDAFKNFDCSAFADLMVPICRLPFNVQGSKRYRPAHCLFLQLASLPGWSATQGLFLSCNLK